MNYKWFDRVNDRWFDVPHDYYVIPHFQAHELACPCCGEIRLDPALQALLPAVRVLFFRQRHKGLRVNSVCRCRKHNNEIEGHPRSLHLTVNVDHDTLGTCAVDFNTDESRRDWDGTDTMILKQILKELGFSIGHGNTFTHGDVRAHATSLPQNEFHYT